MNASLIFSQPSQPGVSQVPLPLAQFPLPSARPEISHRISAGFPSPAADYTEEGLDLNALLVQHKAASFFFTVEGDSMRDAGILDGDKVVVDRSVAPLHGHIVIAVIDSEYTLKRLYCQRGRVELRPDNPAYKSICLAEGSELQIWGVVTGVVRKLRV